MNIRFQFNFYILILQLSAEKTSFIKIKIICIDWFTSAYVLDLTRIKGDKYGVADFVEICGYILKRLIYR